MLLKHQCYQVAFEVSGQFPQICHTSPSEAVNPLKSEACLHLNQKVHINQTIPVPF